MVRQEVAWSGRNGNDEEGHYLLEFYLTINWHDYTEGAQRNMSCAPIRMIGTSTRGPREGGFYNQPTTVKNQLKTRFFLFNPLIKCYHILQFTKIGHAKYRYSR